MLISVGGEERVHAIPARTVARLLAIGAAAALSLAWVPAAAAAANASPTVMSASGDWPQWGYDAAHSGYNPDETTISPSNVARLKLAWKAKMGVGSWSSPVIADGVVYIGAQDGKLYAFAAGCASGGKTCTPLWAAAVGDVAHPTDQLTTPSVANGIVYYGSNQKLYAFAAGCASGGGTCKPLWTGVTGNSIHSSPAIDGGVVYAGSQDSKLYAFPEACATDGSTCGPLWTGMTGEGGINMTSPAVANGVVYTASGDGKLYAFEVGCASGGGTCIPLWTAAAGGSRYPGDRQASPSVANGVVYYPSTKSGQLYAYDARCGNGGGTCQPLWTTSDLYDIGSSPAVANGVVYLGSQSSMLYAYSVGCASGGGVCQPLWQARVEGSVTSSPAVANGLVYIVTAGGVLHAFDAHCSSGGGTCQPLWTGRTSGMLADSSPAVADGVVYVGSDDGYLYAFSLDGVVPPATSTVLPESPNEPGPPTWTLAAGMAAFLIGTLLTLRRSVTGDSRV
jgi:outer membrane protein assembly factor BamB